MKKASDQTAITYEPEKRLLDWVAPRIYRYMKANDLSLIALLGAGLASVGYLWAGYNLYGLLVSSAGIALHWFTDSLDGRVAKLRHEDRPIYGYYLDHLLDAVSAVIVMAGIEYSRLTMLNTWTWAFIAYLLIMIHAFLKVRVTGKLDVSFGPFGPTEARISLIAINGVVMAFGNPILMRIPFTANLFDIIGFLVAMVAGITLVKAVAKTV